MTAQLPPPRCPRLRLPSPLGWRIYGAASRRPKVPRPLEGPQGEHASEGQQLRLEGRYPRWRGRAASLH
eukprot:1611992-Alexandrium_andersonii.AAC.1